MQCLRGVQNLIIGGGGVVFLDEVGQTEKCDSDRKSKRKMYKCSDVFWAEGQTKQGFLVFTPATSARQTKKNAQVNLPLCH